MKTTYDPVDLVLLTCGLLQGASDHGIRIDISIDKAEALEGIAEMLHRLWLEVDADNWSGVFAYDVAEPLGNRLGALMARGEALDATPAEAIARELIKDAMQ